MRLKEKKLLKKFAATLKKFSAQGAKKVEYGMPFLSHFRIVTFISFLGQYELQISKILMIHPLARCLKQAATENNRNNVPSAKKGGRGWWCGV